MYHLKTKQLAMAAVFSVLTLAGTPASALFNPGAPPIVPDQVHSGPDYTGISIPAHFVPVAPLPPVTYDAYVFGGDAVVTVSVDGANNLTIEPINGVAPGTAIIRMEVTDGSGTVNVDFPVRVLNAAPSLDPIGGQSVDENSPLAFIATSSDADDSPFAPTYSLDPHGTTASINPSTGAFSWTPSEADGPGSENFTIRVTTSAGLDDSETISVTVNEVNEDPVLAAIGAQSVDEDDSLTFTASATDGDDPANTLTYSLDPHTTTASINPTTGAFSWTLAEADGPGTENLTIRVSDGAGGEDFETITITINEVNEDPVLAAIGAQSIDEGNPLTFTASATDSDDPANTLTYSLDAHTTTATINPTTGDFSWTPSEADGPGTENLTIRVSDGVGGEDSETITITINEVNEDPVLAAIGAQSIDEGNPLTFTASATDSDDPANTLTYSLDAHTTTATINPTTGDFSWTPSEADGPGTENLTVRVSDGAGGEDFETITITINEVNEDPVLAAIGAQSIDEGNPLTFTASATDVDLPANTLTYSLDPHTTTATINPTTGAFSWTPAETDGPGTENLTVRVSDGAGGEAFETITITINEVNEDPVLAGIGPQSVDEGNPLTFTASATDVDLPANTLTYTLDPHTTTATINPTTGDFSWTPAEADGPGTENLTVRVSDGVGGEASETITITINEVNVDPSLAAIGPQSIDEGSTLSFTAVATDADLPANTFTYSLDAHTTTATINPTTGDFSWTPSETDGPGTENLTVRVNDGAGGEAFETITITIGEVNQAPVLDPIGPQSINEETLLSFTATATDNDAPANGFTFSLDPSAPPGAAITLAGDFTWTPAEADGPGSFPVTVRVTDDGSPAAQSFETFTITVIEINDPPVLSGDVADLPLNEDDPTAFVEVLAEFDDPDLGDTPPDTLTVILLPGHDTGLIDVSLSGTGVNVTPQLHQYGTTTVTVGVQDGAGVQATDTFEVTVASVNDPVTVAAGFTNVLAPEDIGGIFVSMAGAFADIDLLNGGDTHTVTVVSSNPGLIDATNSPIGDLSGTINFAVTPDANGAATITVTAEDAFGSQA